MQKIQCMFFRAIVIATIVFNAVGATAQVNLSQGLMAYYPFSGNANDSSGNGNNPSFNNATLTEDRFGDANQAYEFNGFNTYIQVPNSTTLNTGNKLSISLWVKVNGFYQGACTGNYLLSKGIASSSPNLYDAVFGNAPYGVYKSINFCSTPLDTNHQSFYGAAVGNYNFLTPNIKTGKWYHLAYVYDGSRSLLYVNSVLVDQGPAPSSFTNASDLIFGKYPTDVYWLKGSLDEIRLYNRALSFTEVNTLYSGPSTLGYTLKSFIARPLENAFAAVHFSTVNEVNTASIVVERSENGVEFIPVGTLVAKGGTKENQYDLIDKGLAGMSKVFYRLKMVDKVGSFQYSHVVSVLLNSKTNTKPLSAELFPNPLKGSSATLNLYSAKDQSVTLTVFEISGKIILNKTFNATKGYSQIGLKEFNNIKAGTYSVRLASDTDVVVQKLIKAE